MADEIDYSKLANLTYVGWVYTCSVCHKDDYVSDHDPKLLSKIVCPHCNNELTVYSMHQKIDLSKTETVSDHKTWAEKVKEAHEVHVKLENLKKEIRRSYKGISGERMTEATMKYILNGYKHK